MELQIQSMKKHKLQRAALIIGTGEFVNELLEEIARHPEFGYHIIGLVAWDNQVADNSCVPPLLGSLENINRIIQQETPQVIIVALPHNREGISDHQLLEARVCRKIKIEEAESVYEKITGKLPIQALSPRGVIYSDDFLPGRLTLLATRQLSIFFALIGLVLSAPLLLLIALLIKLDSPGPVLFVQERIGLGGKTFKLMKFRTMRTATERTSEWEGDNVHRITRIGRLLRKFRLDELPQFFNILGGDMNLVGPRPHPASNFELFVLVSRNMPECGIPIPFYSLRTSVLPGITGWAQVRYQYANNINEEIEKLRFDLYYLKHYSLWFDLRIILETVRTVLLGHGSAPKASIKSITAVAGELNPGLLLSPPAPRTRHEKSTYRI
jgi:exopolysaccharide biosynthesis polyprenyl glycosylphosphotransferase